MSRPVPSVRRRPSALARRLYRAPEWLYRLGLGGLLGTRFLLLHHTGRRTGLARHTVLEVMRHDRAADRYLTASAYGEASDWFRNVLANPGVEIQVGRRRLLRVARRVDAEEAERELVEYARRHPLAFRILGLVLGHDRRTPPRELAALMPVIAFVARRGAGDPLRRSPVGC